VSDVLGGLWKLVSDAGNFIGGQNGYAGDELAKDVSQGLKGAVDDLTIVTCPSVAASDNERWRALTRILTGLALGKGVKGAVGAAGEALGREAEPPTAPATTPSPATTPAGAGGAGEAGAAVAGDPAPVTEGAIREAMKGAPLNPSQGAVSLPAIQRYVNRLRAGEEPPPIEVEGNTILDGHHRYIAGRICKKVTPTKPGTSPLSRPVVPGEWDKIKIDPNDWGNK
jgi:hypothetical protein